MGIRLRIDVEPSEAVKAVASLSYALDRASEASWTNLDAALQSWLQGVVSSCRELAQIALELGRYISVNPAPIPGDRDEFRRFISCQAAIELEELSTGRLRRIVELLEVLGRLEGHVVELRLGKRRCTMAEAVAAVQRAVLSAPTRSNGRSRSRREESEERPAGAARRAGVPPAGGAGRQGTNWGPHAGSSGHSHHNGPESGSSGRESHDRQQAAEPRPGSLATQFFVSKTGLRPPYDASGLKRAYRTGARVLHPDHRPGVAEAHGEFCLFTQGYQELVRGVMAG